MPADILLNSILMIPSCFQIVPLFHLFAVVSSSIASSHDVAIAEYQSATKANCKEKRASAYLARVDPLSGEAVFVGTHLAAVCGL